MDHNELSIELIEKFNVPIPRYTSYPMVPYWSPTHGNLEHKEFLEKASKSSDPLSLYIHIPFCSRRCFFCGCNVKISNNPEHSEEYLKYLIKEIKIVSKYLDKRKNVSQLHFGGGTPTHLYPGQLRYLLDQIYSQFNILDNAELSIEAHPSFTHFDHIDVLTDAGFNRLSIGVQDFDEQVQMKVNRFQTVEETRDLIDYARTKGKMKINIDLIYGLPFQTMDGFSETIRIILDIKPDRLAIYSYAHLPKQIKHQSIFPDEIILKGKEKFSLFLKARSELLCNGYNQIGFDHFSLLDDELWIAYKNNTLRRNFMGYTTQAGTDLIGFGYSSISDVAGSYAQNSKSLKDYYSKIDKDGLATERGMALSTNDIICKEVIMNWMCQNSYNPDHLLEKFSNFNISDLLKDFNENLNFFKDLELIRYEKKEWVATKLGKIFARNVASSFDQYLKKKGLKEIYSKAI
ncbi:MAG: Oxygen-independent coproporphyrinogen-III oxidase [Candidatus Heimdallarchaeota archaeon LC_3]|nr:MAG: Oxygen-independent coproporphyrinogen-III oxidase [Candidatus Heimdallarchaeota archaeon LC_3]